MENTNFDELLYSLPDYITGELIDEDLKAQIEAKLLTDSSFREEFESLKSTMNFIRESELEAPSEVYFANLQANILSKVHKDEVPERQSILSRLVGYWKVAIPALTVCVVLVIYMSSMNTTPLPIKNEKVQVPSGETKNNITHDTNLKQNTIAAGESGQTEGAFIEDVFSSDENETDNYKPRRTGAYVPQESIAADESIAATEYNELNTIFGRDDEFQAQDEYEHLSQDDQLEILNSLKEKQL